MAKAPKKPEDDRKPLNLKPMADDEIEQLLTADERAAIELEAEEDALEAKKAQAKDQYRQKVREDRQREAGLLEPQVEVTIDCAPYADRITLDNKVFLQGQRYTMPQSQFAVVSEIMQRTWEHQAEIDGKDENFYRKARNPRVVPTSDGKGATVVGQLLRA